MRADVIDGATGEIVSLPVVLPSSRLYLSLPAEASFDEWAEVGRHLGIAERGVQWWVGDWWRFGERYGERVDIVRSHDWEGPSYQTCRIYGSVANAFSDVFRRRNTLRFSHHAEVAALDATEAERLLDEAEAEGLSTRELRQRVLSARARMNIPAGPVLIPAGKFSVIVLDPPWPMQKIEREVRPNQAGFDYPTMDEEELAAFGETVRSMAADDCHLFMWTTQKFLPMGLRLLDDWSFRYLLTMVWHKPGGFQPVGLPQYNCELILYARQGSPKFIDTRAFDCCFTAPRREHSRKPDEFYELLRRVANGPRVDVFSREPRDGFAQFGNEVGKFAGAA